MASEPPANARKRTVHQLDTPFSTISWPEMSDEDQDTMLELLCSFLSPLGQHRREHVKPSKGKKARRKERKSKGSAIPVVPEDHPCPPAPEFSKNLDVGFNSITRNLEAQTRLLSNIKGASNGSDKKDGVKPYAMIFVARGDQSSQFNCHFPKMVGAASRNLPLDERTRLVGFSKPSSDRLSNTLQMARVSSIAITHDAPGAGALWQMVKSNVKPLDISWLEGSKDVEFLPTKINAVQTVVGSKRLKL